MEALGDADQVGEALGLHLAHDLAAMDADGDLAGAEFGGGLLVEQTGDDVRQDFALAGGEVGMALLQSRRGRGA